MDTTGRVKPQLDDKTTSCHSFGAVFAEVAADPDLGVIGTRRVVAVYDAGKLVNRKLARSQFIGEIVWGIGSGTTRRHTGRPAKWPDHERQLCGLTPSGER